MAIGRKISKFAPETRRNGLGKALTSTAAHARFIWSGGHGAADPVRARRVALFEELRARFDSTIQYGAFKGMRLPKETFWGGPERAPMLFGLYEKEVIAAIEARQNPGGVFIDLGAADGFFGIGVLFAGWFRKSYCYEMSERGRAVLKSNAADHGVGDRVVIRGIAAPGFYSDIPADELDGALVLIDIEGAEFELLDAATLAALARATIIIEIHPWVQDGERAFAALQARAAETHRVSTFEMGPRDPGQFAELRGYSDTDRWLVCSEERPFQMTGLMLEPK